MFWGNFGVDLFFVWELQTQTRLCFGVCGKKEKKCVWNKLIKSGGEGGNSKHLIITTIVSCSGPVYDASVFVGKQEQAAITFKNQFQCFELHDESIVDFDPGGRFGSSSVLFVFKVL